jgi:hypothetical protein
MIEDCPSVVESNSAEFEFVSALGCAGDIKMHEAERRHTRPREDRPG